MASKKIITEATYPKVVYALPPYPRWDWITIKTAATADPAAGADPAEITVPAGRKWLFLGLSGTLVSDVTAVTRVPQCNIKIDGTNIIIKIVNVTGQTQGYTVVHNFTSGLATMGGTLGNGALFSPLPYPLELPPGAKIGISTLNLQAGDNWGVIRYFYKERGL